MNFTVHVADAIATPPEVRRAGPAEVVLTGDAAEMVPEVLEEMASGHPDGWYELSADEARERLGQAVCGLDDTEIGTINDAWIPFFLLLDEAELRTEAPALVSVTW